MTTLVSADVDDHASEAKAEATYRGRRRSRRIVVLCAQLSVLVVVIGGWQVWVGGDQRKVILFGQPSRIVERLHTWITVGTAIGSLGDQIAATLEEAILGFAIGTTLGIVFGLALGRVPFLASVFGPFI